ncbi:SOS response-associated peptidase family protein [Leptospira wolffii]|uniref:Abasic site processing protein n=1 Tax=Leptospira wolffii TaxID=409998 RepID=A0ABV5BTW2_9LEPT
MCGRYSINASASQVIEQFLLFHEEEKIKEEYRQEKEVFPTKVEPLVREVDRKRTLQNYHWGLENIEINGAKLNKPVINATFEKLLKIKMWSVPLFKNRCIVPVTSYTEWKELDKNRRDRYEIYFKEESIFGFPGLICPFTDKNGKETEGFVIITMPANEHISFVHHRQPGVILKENYDAWLDPKNKNPEKSIHYVEGTDYHYILTKPAPPPKEKVVSVNFRKKKKSTDQPSLFEEE